MHTDYKKVTEQIQSWAKPFGILGFGISGKATFELLKEIGIQESEILIADANESAATLSRAQLLDRAKTLFVSPGVPLNNADLFAYRSKGGRITSELTLAAHFLREEKIIAVTGSLGKSTLTSLIYEGLRSYNSNCFAGGNLGTPLARYVLTKLRQKQTAPWLVLELSSYQLENCEGLVADYSLITYLAPNHLERYQDLNHYYDTKWALVARTKHKVFLNIKGGDLKDYAKKKIESESPSNLRAISWVNTEVNPLIEKYQLQDNQMVGSHNKQNITFAAALLSEMGAPPEAFKALRSFKGLAHRLENLGVRLQRRWINDSKSTTITSVLSAVQSCLQDQQRNFLANLSNTTPGLTVFIGGKDKNLPWEQLNVLKGTEDLKFVFFGEVGELAKKASGLSGEYFAKLEAALFAGFKLSEPGDTLLLSPGGASQDEFKSFEERGDFFRAWVGNLT